MSRLDLHTEMTASVEHLVRQRKMSFHKKRNAINFSKDILQIGRESNPNWTGAWERNGDIVTWS
jgi:hypothetical protein